MLKERLERFYEKLRLAQAERKSESVSVKELKKLMKNCQYSGEIIENENGELEIGGYVILDNTLVELPEKVKRIKGNLTGNPSILRLPERLQVDGDLILRNFSNLEKLPKGLKVGGMLQCHSTVATNWEENFQIILQTGCRDLSLNGLRNVSSIPEGLHLTGSLTCSFCWDLKSLPMGLKVAGKLCLASCYKLGFQRNMEIICNSGCHDLILGWTQFEGFPENFELPGDLHVASSKKFQHFSKACKIGGELYLRRVNIWEIPTDMQIGGSIQILNCKNFKTLPDNFYVNGSLTINGCPNFSALPEGLHVKGDLTLTNCESLTTLPDDLHFEGHLNVSGCHSLTTLPIDLHIKGYLEMSHCLSLNSLPAGLKVNGSMNVRSCSSLESLPSDLSINGSLDLRYCTKLKALPNCILALTFQPDGEYNDIELYGSGILASQETVELLKEINISGVNLLCSYNEQILQKKQFHSLDEAIQYWIDIAGLETKGFSLMDIPNSKEILKWVSSFRGTKEFIFQDSQKKLATKIVSALKLLAESENRQTSILDIIESNKTKTQLKVLNQIVSLNNSE